MSCLVAGLLALGMLGLGLGSLGLFLGGDAGVGVRLTLFGALFLCVGLVAYRRTKATIRPGVEVGLAIALAAGMLLLLFLILPAFLCYRKDARPSLCINNMRLIDHAKEALAIQNKWTSGQIIADTPAGIWAVLDPYVDGTNMLSCPEAPGRHYIYAPVDVIPRCPVADKHPDHVYRPY